MNTFTTTHTMPDDFIVTDMAHNKCEFCTQAAEQAISLARATGSVGSRCTFSGLLRTEHAATVRRSA